MQSKDRINPQDTQQDEWDCLLDPYQCSIGQGREEGRIAGLESGYREGYALGHMKALEIGVEIGYMLGFAQTTLEHLNSRLSAGNDENNDGIGNLHRSEKLRLRLCDFIDSMERFPTPDDMFSGNIRDPTVLSNAEENDDTNQFNIPKAVDITESMQRLRARFKALTVQLKVPNLSHKKVLEQSIPPITNTEELGVGTLQSRGSVFNSTQHDYQSETSVDGIVTIASGENRLDQLHTSPVDHDW